MKSIVAEKKLNSKEKYNLKILPQRGKL